MRVARHASSTLTGRIRKKIPRSRTSSRHPRDTNFAVARRELVSGRGCFQRDCTTHIREQVRGWGSRFAQNFAQVSGRRILSAPWRSVVSIEVMTMKPLLGGWLYPRSSGHCPSLTEEPRHPEALGRPRAPARGGALRGGDRRVHHAAEVCHRKLPAGMSDVRLEFDQVRSLRWRSREG